MGCWPSNNVEFRGMFSSSGKGGSKKGIVGNNCMAVA